MLDTELDQRHPEDLGIRDADRVERDVDATCLFDHGPQVFIDGMLVQRVDDRRRGGSAGPDDVLGEHFERSQVAAGEEQPRSLPGEGVGDRPADGASRPVDDGNLVLEQHRWCRHRAVGKVVAHFTVRLVSVPAKVTHG